MNITEQDIDDLETILCMASSNDYITNATAKTCGRVQELIDKIKNEVSTNTNETI